MKTIQAIVQIPWVDVQSPNYEANLKRFGEDHNSCFICGKRIKNMETAKSVQYLNNGNLVSTGEDMENSQGFFPVGSDCAKKLIISFAF